MLFVPSVSPILSKYNILRSDLHVLKYNEESGTCSFRQIFLFETAFDVASTGSDIGDFGYLVMIRFESNPEKQVVKNVFVNYEEQCLSFFLENLQNRIVPVSFVCSVMSDDCSMQEENCVQKLAALPIAEGSDVYFDGNSQGCRIVHAVLAQVNEKHCAHLAFEPTADTDGKIKCQESLGYLRTDFFEESDIEVH